MKIKLMTKNIIILVVILAVIFLLMMFKTKEDRKEFDLNEIVSFEECVNAGYPIMESYPRQCITSDGQIYVEELPVSGDFIVGGDADEHGCIGSSGYSWCEPKNKCLRIWEEACYESAGQEIQYILAGKYDRPVNEVRINILKEKDDFVSGSILFGQGGPGEGGMFLAKKINNIWQLLYDGNGSVDCENLRTEHEFPEEILRPNFCD
jgi:hypothetical protein